MMENSSDEYTNIFREIDFILDKNSKNRYQASKILKLNKAGKKTDVNVRFAIAPEIWSMVKINASYVRSWKTFRQIFKNKNSLSLMTIQTDCLFLRMLI